MRPGGSALWWGELSPAWELVGELVLLAGLVAIAGGVLVGAAWLGGAVWSRWLKVPVRSWRRRRAVRCFVAAVSAGELDVAEVALRQTMSGGFVRRRPGSVPLRGWDEQVVLGCSAAQAAAELEGPGGFASWCPGVRRVAEGEDALVVGRRRGVRLRVLSRGPVSSGGAWFTADAGGSVIVGHVMLRPVTQAASAGEAVAVWVHVEGPRGRRSRRVMSVVRRATRVGLRRWAAGGRPPAVRNRRPRGLQPPQGWCTAELSPRGKVQRSGAVSSSRRRWWSPRRTT